MPLLDLQAQFEPIRAEIYEAVHRVIDSQRFILGDDVRLLEGEIAEYCRTKFAIGCASGSDALLLALKAHEIGPGDEVLTTPFSFFATAGEIAHSGARTVFADIDETANLDPASVARVLDRHPKVKAIIAVHLYGACCDMGPLLELAADRGIPVIEDAAQAIGSEYESRRAGSMGSIGCFSFFPSKNLGAFGDGGILTTDDAELADRLLALRLHGSRKKYYYDMAGFNSRLDTLQAAVLRVKLRYLDNWTAGRQRNAQSYRDRLSGVAGLQLPVTAPYQTRHIYNQFVVRTEQRDRLQKHLADAGIGTEIYYPLPLHLQQCFADLGYGPSDFPVSERFAQEALALPIFPELANDDLNYICESIEQFFTA